VKAGIIALGSLATGLLFGTALAGAARADTPEVIYGDDNRRDLFSPDNDPRMVELARSTAMLTYKSNLTIDPNDPTVSTLPLTTFGEANNLCEDEPFRDQPDPAFCSGFLVGPTTLVTAGHCVRTQDACADIAFVFDFGLTTQDREVTKLANDSVYACHHLVTSVIEASTQSDFAIVELDRPVTGREPLRFRREGSIEMSAPVTVIGHPAGLPTKISGGANVRSNDQGAYFVANLDTYGGNSGSAVFNDATGEVEGILVRGENDFVSRGSCRVSNRCENDACRGEDVTRATEFASFIVDPDAPVRPTRAASVALDQLALAIPDDDPAGVSQAIEVTDAGELADVQVHVHITHTYVADLTVVLVHPDGTEVTLYQRAGGGGHDVDMTYGGPDGQLVTGLVHLRGKPAAGTWHLIVRDEGASDTGTLDSVTLTTSVYTDTPAATAE
jgi:subtilisin-like proprotein convertase family protein